MFAAKAFKGDPDLYNPEDLLLSSVVSSHDVVLICLYKMDRRSYTDEAEATLEVLKTLEGRFIAINHNPKVSLIKRK
jgi:hypothetical protein